MSQLNHSPGPWKAAKGHGGGEAHVVDAENWEICVPRTRADVRLIAAAPDLLRLLRVLCWPYDIPWDKLADQVMEARELVSRLDGGK